MLKVLAVGIALLFLSSFGFAQEPEADAATEPETAVDDEQVETVADEGPKTMSGMSILGNEEAPKSLVIIPWKASELGEDISLTNTLDDRAQPVDKDVFLRELSFYRIRSGE